MARQTDPTLVFWSLATAVLSYAVSQTMLVPSLPEIEATFHTTPTGVTALMTSFWVSGAVTAVLFGRLGDMFGKRRMLVVVMVLFCGGAAIAALAPSLIVMIAGRVLMGCGVAVFPLTYSLIRDELPTHRVVSAIAVVGGLAAIGAVVGQSTGGLISDQLGYAWIFWIPALMGLVSIAALFAFVPESPVRTGGRVDLVGATLLASGLAVPLVAISKAPTWGWGSDRTLVLFAIGVGLLAAFTLYELRRDEPLIHIPTLVLPQIRLTNAATLFAGVGLFGTSTILSQFFQEPTSSGYGFGANATQAGLFLVPGLLLMALTTPFAGRLSSRFGPTITLRLGIAIGTIGIAGMTLSHAHQFEMYLWPSVMYIGIGGAMGAMPTIVLQSVPPEQSGQSSAINLVLRNAGTAVGIQLAATILTASLTSAGVPTDRGYTAAFGVATIGCLIAFVLSLKIPRVRLARAKATGPESLAYTPAPSLDV